MFKDGNGAYYDAAASKFISTPFGMTLPAGASTLEALVATPYYTPFDFGTTAVFAQKADNSVAGEMRDCGECHVGGGLMEYMIDPVKTTASAYDPAKRTSLREYVFGGAVTAFNALIDIFNADPTHRGDVVVQNYAETGVLEMDCLICHQKDYSWEKRKEAVRKGEFDASRALGANLALSAKDGVNVFYNSTSVSTTPQGLVVDLSAKINAKPASAQCTSCHLGTAEEKYQVDWKKRGEMWTAVDANGNKLQTEVHTAIGCMGCHERMDKSDASVGTNGLTSNTKLGLCDPAKGGASPFDAMWNQMDKKEFKDCKGCHEATTAPTYLTYGAPDSRAAHTRAGLTAKVAFDASGANVSHIDLIDCTACHVKKSGFTGGAFVDGTGADEEGRVAVHDTEYVAKDMANGTAVHWQGGKLYSANLLTSFFWRDMNGLKTANGGLDANNDGREAGMDPLLQTHVSNINHLSGLHPLTEDGIIDAAEITVQKNALAANIRGQLGVTGDQTTNAFLPKLSFLMVPFKASHNIAGADKAWGVKGCKECHSAAGTVIAAADPDNRSGAEYAAGGFYNGTYPINGNMDGNFSFDSDQVTTYTKVNGLVDVTDSHPNVVTKDGTRAVPVKLLTMFDNPYTQTKTPGQTLKNIDRSEVIYEQTFQTLDTTWYDAATGITGGVISAACTSTSPFYCEDPAAIWNAAKKGATSTIGWTMKVEILGEDGSTVTTRTKSVMDDKIVSVDGIIAALGVAFTDNADFTVENAGGALKLTPKGLRKIRLSKQCDVGPFGLKGKLWKAAPITRGGATYTGRADFVTHLNSITKADAGVGVAPTAVIGAIDGMPATGFTSIQLTKGVAYELNAVNTASFTTYTWDTNAGVAVAPGPVSSVTFNKAGTWRITLSAKNPDGQTVTKLQRVNVVEPSLMTLGTVSSAMELTKRMTTVPVDITAPDYDTVKFSWGDGSKSTRVTALPLADQKHQYLRFAKYAYTQDGVPGYLYTTTVQLFKGAVYKGGKSFKVFVPTTVN